MIELSGLKLRRDRIEAEKQELENKDVVDAQQEILNVQNQICATKIQNRNILQVKEGKLNKL